MASPIVQGFHMNGGTGSKSFANNSLTTKKVMMRVKHVLEESINKLFCGNPPTSFNVADLGCSCGPNTLFLISNIIQIVHEISLKLKAEPPPCQIFLNDLFGNDFNSLFKSIPEFYGTLKQDTCFINATPGNFYGALFPSNSIHFIHSSFSVHWLSQVPNLKEEEVKVGDVDKGDIYAMSVTQPSYAKQFKNDFILFLRSRHKELVPRGGIFLTFLGRYDTAEYISNSGLLRMALEDLVSKNLIEEAKLKQFNVPMYCPTLNEVREIIKEEGSFDVERLESIKLSWDASSLDDEVDTESFKDDNERAEFITGNRRSVFEPLLLAHFGEEIMDELFVRFKNRVIQFLPKLEDPVLVISLTKSS